MGILFRNRTFRASLAEAVFTLLTTLFRRPKFKIYTILFVYKLTVTLKESVLQVPPVISNESAGPAIAKVSKSSLIQHTPKLGQLVFIRKSYFYRKRNIKKICQFYWLDKWGIIYRQFSIRSHVNLRLSYQMKRL